MNEQNTPNFETTVVEGLRAIYKQLGEQTKLLERIAVAVESQAMANVAAPNYQHSLESFNQFNWASIGAAIERSDEYGAAIVSWRGQQFTRRSPQNKFDPAIWFSRCTGKDESGENRYERLITFKPLSKQEVEPVPDKTARFVGGDRPN